MDLGAPPALASGFTPFAGPDRTRPYKKKAYIHNQKIPFETLSIIPEPVARNHNIVAYKQTEDSLEVAMLDTEDLS